MTAHSGGFVKDQAGVLPGRPLEGQAGTAAQAVGSRGGAGSHQPKHVKRASLPPSYTAEGDDWLPRWIREHVERNSPAKDVIEDALRRVSTSPDRETLLEAELLLNELGRLPDNASLVRETVGEVSRALFTSEG